MNPIEEILRNMAKQAEEKKRFAHLTTEQRVDKMMEGNRAFWENIKFNTLPDGDERGRLMQQLLVTLRDADLAQYHRDHFFIDEDEAPRKESKLRCKYWDKHHEMVMAAFKYAEYCGYITADHAAMDMASEEIDAKYEAMKPADGESVRADGPEETPAE